MPSLRIEVIIAILMPLVTLAALLVTGGKALQKLRSDIERMVPREECAQNRTACGTATAGRVATALDIVATQRGVEDGQLRKEREDLASDLRDTRAELKQTREQMAHLLGAWEERRGAS